jgi:predicted dithiol-disulfide oxidoreductase (DUF899 family)
MSWTFSWVSSLDSDFTFHFGMSFTPEDTAAGREIYNYGTVIRMNLDMSGGSVFVTEDDDGAILDSYSTDHPGGLILTGSISVPRAGTRASAVMNSVWQHGEYLTEGRCQNNRGSSTRRRPPSRN